MTVTPNPKQYENNPNFLEGQISWLHQVWKLRCTVYLPFTSLTLSSRFKISYKRNISYFLYNDGDSFMRAGKCFVWHKWCAQINFMCHFGGWHGCQLWLCNELFKFMPLMCFVFMKTRLAVTHPTVPTIRDSVQALFADPNILIMSRHCLIVCLFFKFSHSINFLFQLSKDFTITI